MRKVVDAKRLRELMGALAKEAGGETRVYFTGGGTAVDFGWRTSTIDVDLKIVPDSDAILRSIPRIKEQLQINIELAAPDQFIPELPGWAERSIPIERIGLVGFFHYDPYSQALAKIERGHGRDTEDVRAMIHHRLIDPGRLLDFFAQIEPGLYRYPAIDPPSFRRAVEQFVKSLP